VPPPGGDIPPGYGGYGAYGGYGGYGGGGPYGYGGYGVPPAPQPGVIPLRPLSVSEILSGAVNAIRSNPGTILGASAIVSAVSGALAGLAMFVLLRDAFTGVTTTSLGDPTTIGITLHQVGQMIAAAFALLGVTLIFTAFTNIILTGGLTVAIGQAVLGRRESFAGAWRSTSRRIGALFATVLLQALFLALGWLAAAGLSIGAGLLLGRGLHLVAAGILVGVLGVFTATVFAAIIGIRWSLAIPVVMLERRGPLASLGRSWQLVRGSAWRVFGITALAQIIIGCVSGMIRMPFSIASGGSLFLAPVTHPTGASELVSVLGSVIAAAITTPLLAGVVVLLYADLRMRKEGLAATLQSAAHGQASPGGDDVNPW
jgi:glycerophosphoryl diester phosphodiesterase family protein